MAAAKTKPTEISVADFIATIPDETRRADATTLSALLQKITGEKPKMWGTAIIGFGSYHYVNPGGSEGDMPLIGFSPRKSATVIYGMSGMPAQLFTRLGKHKLDGGCLHIRNMADVDLAALKSLIMKSAAARQAK